MTADLEAKGLTKDEATALLAICDFASGSPDLKKTIRAPYHEAIDALIAKGFVHQVWALSKTGRDLLGLRDDD